MWKKYLNKKNKFAEGYTLIETMIALAIFLIVIVLGVGALLNAYSVNKKSQNMRSIMDSLSYTMEDMSRNVRTGYNYHCLVKGEDPANISTPNSCLTNGYGMAFEYSDGDPTKDTDQWVYYISNGKLFRSTDGFANSVQMTPDEVVLQADSSTYNFSVLGASGNPLDDQQQPLVVIRLIGKITDGKNVTPFSLETAVSQRLNDI